MWTRWIAVTLPSLGEALSIWWCCTVGSSSRFEGCLGRHLVLTGGVKVRNAPQSIKSATLVAIAFEVCGLVDVAGHRCRPHDENCQRGSWDSLGRKSETTVHSGIRN